MRTMTESMQPILRTMLGFLAEPLASTACAIRSALRRPLPPRSGPRVMPMVRGLSASVSISLTMRNGAGASFESVHMQGDRHAVPPVAANGPAWDEAARPHRYG